MTDIVELLRDGNVCSREHNTCRNDWRMEEAAIEIERLREENARLVTNARSDALLLGAYHKWCQMHDCAPSSSDLFVARAALKEDKPFEDRWDNA